MWFCKPLCFENNQLSWDMNFADRESRVALVVNRLEGKLRINMTFPFWSSINIHIDTRNESLSLSKTDISALFFSFLSQDQPHLVFDSILYWKDQTFQAKWIHPFCVRNSWPYLLNDGPKRVRKQLKIKKFQQNLIPTPYACSLVYCEDMRTKRIVLYKSGAL